MFDVFQSDVALEKSSALEFVIKRVGYNMDIMRQCACMAVNPITVDSYDRYTNY